MAKDKDGAMDALSQNLKRQIGTQANARLLRRMPIFSVDQALPQDMKSLLRDLDAAERGRRGNSDN